MELHKFACTVHRVEDPAYNFLQYNLISLLCGFHSDHSHSHSLEEFPTLKYHIRASDGNYVLRQQLDKKATGKGTAWNPGDPFVILGDMRWMNYTASIDVMFEENSGEDDPYAAISIRQTGASHHMTESSGYTFAVSSCGEWKLYRKKEVKKTGLLTVEDGFHTGKNVWNTLCLSGEKNRICAYVGGHLVARYDDPEPVRAGRIGLGTSFSYVRFDNLKVKKNDQTVPYFTELLDDFEIYDLTENKNVKLRYNEKWTHQF